MHDIQILCYLGKQNVTFFFLVIAIRYNTYIQPLHEKYVATAH